MKHKRHRVGAAEGLMGDIIEGVLPGLGVIGAHELKGMLPASWATSMSSSNYSLLVNGIGFAAGVGIPLAIKNREVKKYVAPLGWGVAAQCLYSIFLNNVAKTVPPVVNKTWNTYALGKPSTYALGCVQQPDGSMVYYQQPTPAGGTTSGNGAATPASTHTTPATLNPAATPNRINPTVKLPTPIKRIQPNQVQPVQMNGSRKGVGGF